MNNTDTIAPIRALNIQKGSEWAYLDGCGLPPSLRLVLACCMGHPEDACRVEAFNLWQTLGRPNGGYMSWMTAVGLPFYNGQPYMLTASKALEVAVLAPGDPGGRVRGVLKDSKLAMKLMMRLKGFED